MAAAAWSIWVKWNVSIEQTLIDGHHLVAGDATVAEARRQAVKSRTPGLLDVVTLDDRPHLGRCWVLSQQELHQHFGSRTPAKRAIEAGSATFIQRLEPAQAVAITAYVRGAPAAVLFAGKPD